MKNTLLSNFAGFKNLRNALVFISLLAISGIGAAYLMGCSSGPTTPGTGNVSFETTTIYGRVVDEAGTPVAGVSLTGGTGTAVTDANGIFIIKNTTVPQGGAVVIGKKAGYFDGAHAAAPSSNGTTRIEFSMMSDASTGNVAATTGGTVNIAAGGSIAFAAGSFTDASGAAYTGQVKVSARYLDPKNNNFFDFFSGDDMAQTAAGKSASLISCGVLRVELKDANGNQVKLNSSMPATLNFPKPLDTKAPASMPLWYFDQTLGMWKEEGSATLKNGMYTGTVAHFSDWNLDYHDSVGGYSTASVSLRVVCNGVPISGVAVSIVGDDAPGKYFVHPGGQTGSDGTITFLRFPDNRPTQIDINSAKNNGLYFINTPISVTVASGQTLNLGDVSLNSPCPASLQGTLIDCNGAKAEGLVIVSDGTHINYNYTKTGDFLMQAAGGIALTVDATDVNGNQATTVNVPALASGEQRNIGSIKICGSGTANFIDITIPISFGGIKQEGQSVALSPDGTRLAIVTLSNIGIFDTKTGTMVSSGTMTGGSNYIGGIQFSKDNMKLLVSVTYSGGAALFDVSGATATNLLTIASVTGAKLSDDGTQIIGLIGHGTSTPSDLNVYNASNGNIILTTHPGNMADSSSIYGFDRDENAVVYPDGATNGLAHVWGITGNTELRNFPVIGTKYYFIASEDGLTIASSADYTNYTFYTTKTGQSIGSINAAGTNSTSRYGGLIVTKNNAYESDQVDSATVIRILNIANGTSTIKLFSGASYINSIAASRSEVNVAAVSNGKIRIWTLP